MFALVTMPSATSTFSSMSGYTSGVFDEFLPYVLGLVGLVVGAIILAKLASVIYKAVGTALGKKKGRGGRRRRR